MFSLTTNTGELRMSSILFVIYIHLQISLNILVLFDFLWVTLQFYNGINCFQIRCIFNAIDNFASSICNDNKINISLKTRWHFEEKYSDYFKRFLILSIPILNVLILLSVTLIVLIEFPNRIYKSFLTKIDRLMDSRKEK